MSSITPNLQHTNRNTLPTRENERGEAPASATARVVLDLFGKEVEESQLRALYRVLNGKLAGWDTGSISARVSTYGLHLLGFRTASKIYLIEEYILPERFIARGSFTNVYALPALRLRLKDNQIQRTTVALKKTNGRNGANDQLNNAMDLRDYIGARRGIEKQPKVYLANHHRDDNEAPILLVETFYNVGALSQWLSGFLKGKTSPIQLETIVESREQLIGALRDLHALEIRHGDIKLNNILMKWRKDKLRIDLADFGGSRTRDSLESTWKDLKGKQVLSTAAIRKLNGAWTAHNFPLSDWEQMLKAYDQNNFDVYWQTAKATDVFMLGNVLFCLMRMRGYIFPAPVSIDLGVIGVTYLEDMKFPILSKNTGARARELLISKGWPEEISAFIGSSMQKDPQARLEAFC